MNFHRTESTFCISWGQKYSSLCWFSLPQEQSHSRSGTIIENSSISLLQLSHQILQTWSIAAWHFITPSLKNQKKDMFTSSLMFRTFIKVTLVCYKTVSTAAPLNFLVGWVVIIRYAQWKDVTVISLHCNLTDFPTPDIKSGQKKMMLLAEAQAFKATVLAGVLATWASFFSGLTLF